MKKLMSLCIVIITATVLSCSDDPLKSAPSDYDFSSDNILSFKDGQEAVTYVQNYSKNNDSKFKSFNALYIDVLSRLLETESLDEHTKLLNNNKGVVLLIDETYTPTMKSKFYRIITNKDRMYVSNNLVHKVIDDQNIVFTDKKYATVLKNIESIDNLNAEIFKIVQYQQNEVTPPSGRILANCGAEVWADYFDNHSKCKDDRRAWVHATATFSVSGYYYTPYVLAEVLAEKRSGTFCNWGWYDNTFYNNPGSFTVAASLNGTVYSYSGYLPAYGGTNGNEAQHIMYQGPAASAIYWTGGATPTIQFSQIHMEGSHNGVGANDPTHYAVYDCQ